MKKNTIKKKTGYRSSGGMYRNINISIRLLDAVIIGGLLFTAFLIMVSV